jgi:hypothetical protein
MTKEGLRTVPFGTDWIASKREVASAEGAVFEKAPGFAKRIGLDGSGCMCMETDQAGGRHSYCQWGENSMNRLLLLHQSHGLDVSARAPLLSKDLWPTLQLIFSNQKAIGRV